MFILDSLMIAGLRWVLETTATAAEAEMNDDAALREQLLEAEMRREMREITDREFREIEADLLGRIRAIRERRGGAGPLGFAGQGPIETTGAETYQVEASVAGDFYDPGAAPHTTALQSAPASGQTVTVLDIEPGEAAAPEEPTLADRSQRDVPPIRAVRLRRSATRARTRPKAKTPPGRAARTGRRTRPIRTKT